MKKKIVLLALAFVLLGPGLNVLAATPATDFFYLSYSNDALVVGNVEVGDSVQLYYTANYGTGFSDVMLNNRRISGGVSGLRNITTTITAGDKAYHEGLVLRRYSNSGGVTIKLHNVLINGEEVFDADTDPDPVLLPFEKTGVTDLAYTATGSSYKVTWKNPTVAQHVSNQITVNGKYIGNISKQTSYSVTTAVYPNTTYTVEVDARYTDNSAVTKTITFKTPGAPAGEVTELSGAGEIDQAVLTWKNPASTYFKNAIVYRVATDGTKTKLGETTGTTYTVGGLETGKTYKYSVATMSTEGMESEGVAVSVFIEPPKPIAEVTELAAVPDVDKVELSWKLPVSSKFQKVTLYRDGVKIHETDGTTFTDTSLEPETTYIYKLTTTSTEGAESAGVTREVTTLEIPPPKISGGSYTKDPATGDFIYTWKEPTEGTVKVSIDGTEYKTVDSADKKIVIPAALMKYSYLGDPLITLEPFGTDGKPGPVVDTGDSIKDIVVPFSPADLLKTSNGLIFLIGGFLLLLLCFIFVPKFIKMIRGSFGKAEVSEATETSARRFQSDQEGQESRGRTRNQATIVSGAQVVHKEARKAPRLPREPKTQRARREGRTGGRVPREPRTGRS